MDANAFPTVRYWTAEDDALWDTWCKLREQKAFIKVG